MLTPEQRAKVEEQGSREARGLFQVKPNPPGGFARAMDSIRHEVVERPWFGREVTGEIGVHPADQKTYDDRIKELYGRSPDQHAEAPAQGLDIHGNPMSREAQAPSEVKQSDQHKKPPEAGLEPPTA